MKLIELCRATNSFNPGVTLSLYNVVMQTSTVKWCWQINSVSVKCTDIPVHFRVSGRRAMLQAMTSRFLCRTKPLWMNSLLRFAVYVCFFLVFWNTNVFIDHWLPCVFVFQAEDIRLSIDKIDESVTEIKKLYSNILSAPTSDQSNVTAQHLSFSLPAVNKIHLWLSLFRDSRWRWSAHQWNQEIGQQCQEQAKKSVFSGSHFVPGCSSGGM